VIRSDCEHLTFGLITRPPWASAIGRDRFGLWTEFQLDAKAWPPVKQRMRWIPPGRFMMGSPEDEPGRWPDEGPQHLVTVSTGFWLFDTACTQRLWQALMGENPSRFSDDPGLPVDSVSWNDCNAFIQRINAANPGLNLVLPSEAQWEYACRAGTTTPFSLGLDITLRDVNFSVGRPQKEGEEVEFKDRPVPVGTLPANPWGLHEMHGNLWEWCADHFHPNYEGAPVDGSPWLDHSKGGARRVLRGGSWNDAAGGCRSAARIGIDPGARRGNIGFRCARVQA
jgi:formylglycine-generating enzyme required for sulfatase activity